MLKKEIKKLDHSTAEDLLVLTSHEMGIPLSIAIFQLENIFSKCKKCGEDFGTDFFIAKKSLYQLQTVIGNILHMRKFDLGTLYMVTRQVDLCSLLKEASKEYKLLAKAKNIEFSLKTEIKKALVKLDASLFCHALTNLFQNALKFTPVGGTIQIHFFQEKKSFVLQVIDTGIGIPQKQKKSIFQKYFTGHTPKCHGLGLGLYLVKNIIDEHQYEMEVRDTPGGGATFEIRIPIP